MPATEPESQGKSLDIAVGDAWVFGAGLLVHWLAPHHPWWYWLTMAAAVGASTYGLRRLKAHRRRSRGTYWGEVRHAGVHVEVESNDAGVVERALREFSGTLLTDEELPDAQH